MHKGSLVYSFPLFLVFFSNNHLGVSTKLKCDLKIIPKIAFQSIKEIQSTKFILMYIDCFSLLNSKKLQGTQIQNGHLKKDTIYI